MENNMENNTKDNTKDVIKGADGIKNKLINIIFIKLKKKIRKRKKVN